MIYLGNVGHELWKLLGDYDKILKMFFTILKISYSKQTIFSSMNPKISFYIIFLNSQKKQVLFSSKEVYVSFCIPSKPIYKFPISLDKVLC